MKTLLKTALAGAAALLTAQAASAAIVLATPANLTMSGGETMTAATMLPGGPYSRDIYVQFRVTLSPTTVINDNDFAALILSGNNSNTTVNIGIKGNQGGVPAPGPLDYFARTALVASQTAYAAPNIGATTGRSVYLTGRLSKSGAPTSYYDTFDLWTSTTSQTLEAALASAPSATAHGSTGLTTIDRFRFRDVNLDAGDAVTFSAISIGTVPEPGSVGLMAAAGLAGLVARRRRA